MNISFMGAAVGRPNLLSRSLKSRREVVTRHLEELRQTVPNPRILCVEDQSLTETEQLPLYSASPCSAAAGERTDALTGCFDFIDAVAALGKLGDGPARRLVERLVRLLCPGGSLLVSSYTPEALSQGILRGDGSLQCRTEFQMAGLLKPAAGRDVIGHAVWRSADDAVVYLEVRK